MTVFVHQRNTCGGGSPLFSDETACTGGGGGGGGGDHLTFCCERMKKNLYGLFFLFSACVSPCRRGITGRIDTHKVMLKYPF